MLEFARLSPEADFVSGNLLTILGMSTNLPIYYGIALLKTLEENRIKTSSCKRKRKYRKRIVLKLVKIMNFVPLWNKLPHKTLKYT